MDQICAIASSGDHYSMDFQAQYSEHTSHRLPRRYRFLGFLLFGWIHSKPGLIHQKYPRNDLAATASPNGKQV
jgi:hypothetical protein